MKSSTCILTILFLLFSTQIQAFESSVTINDSIILASVREGDISVLKRLLGSREDINRLFGHEERTLLSLAIEKGQIEATGFLVEEGSDLELINEGKTPLMFAAKHGRDQITELLITNGANVGAVNEDKNTAFLYAAKNNNLEILKILYKHGSAINLQNEKEWTALDFAIINNNKQIQEYLESIGCITFEKNIPDYFDGPYINITEPGKLCMKYLVHDEQKSESSIISEEISLHDSIERIPDLKNNENYYDISLVEASPPSIYEEPSKVIVMGDIHGQYQRMVKMLKSAGVIDNNLNWIWGDGHLVFVGDVFDRGEGVMESLWLIYNLEKKAEKYDGKVHLLIGNHEMMIINNDIRYIANKYYSLTSNLNINYPELFSTRSILGKWIRTKNVVEIIGETMFVHAGISPELAAKKLSISEINSSFREYLYSEPDTLVPDLSRLLKGSYGPVWYRGYLTSRSNYNKIKQDDLEAILDQYGVKHVVIGHTEVDNINRVCNGKVIPVNIPLANKSIIEQALLIENNVFYRVTSEKSKTQL